MSLFEKLQEAGSSALEQLSRQADAIKKASTETQRAIVNSPYVTAAVDTIEYEMGQYKQAIQQE